MRRPSKLEPRASTGSCQRRVTATRAAVFIRASRWDSSNFRCRRSSGVSRLGVAAVSVAQHCHASNLGRSPPRRCRASSCWITHSCIICSWAGTGNRWSHPFGAARCLCASIECCAKRTRYLVAAPTCKLHPSAHTLNADFELRLADCSFAAALCDCAVAACAALGCTLRTARSYSLANSRIRQTLGDSSAKSNV